MKAVIHSASRILPDELYLKLLYRHRMGRSLNISNPASFNEKLQWLKLHDRNPLYTTLVDKYAVKQWVAERIGEEYVVPSYACWDRAEDVDISGLPERFVLKTNHDCGGVVVCSDRDAFDLDAARIKLAGHLRRNYYWGNREWPYRNVRPCVFAEEFLEPELAMGDLPDYKLFRFTDGRVMTLVCAGRTDGPLMRKTFFDEEWHPLPLSEGGHPVDLSHPRPPHLEEMLRAARTLGDGMPFVRVDFYETPNRPLFGEMTLYPNAGFERFDPPEWDYRLGELVDLKGPRAKRQLGPTDRTTQQS